MHGPGVFFIFPSRLASQERHVSAAGFPAFLGGGSLASGQAVDDGRGPFLLWTSIPAAALLLHAAAILWRRRGEKNLPVPELARSRVFSVSVLLLFLLDALVPFRLLMGERILPWQGVNGLAILLLAWWGGYCAEGLLNPQTSPRRRQVMWTVFASAFFSSFCWE